MSRKVQDWQYNEKEEAELLFLALAAKHHGGQQQTTIERNTDLGDDESDVDSCYDDNGVDDTAESTISSHVADPAYAGIKRKLLDHFAELLARKKDPGFVSCNILVEERAEATLLFTRNKAFDEDSKEDMKDERVDREFFAALSAQVADIRRGQSSFEMGTRAD